MDRISFFRLLGLGFLLPKTVEAAKQEPIPEWTFDLKEVAAIPERGSRGLSDVLCELELYETCRTYKPSDIETINGEDVVTENRLQIFRNCFQSENGEINDKEADRHFSEAKRWLDEMLINGKSAISAFTNELSKGVEGNEPFAIQTMSGLDEIITQKGVWMNEDVYGIRLFDNIINVLNHVNAPKEYLMVVERKEHDKIMTSPKVDGRELASNKGGYNKLAYGKYVFHITPLDICPKATSYLIPLCKTKTKSGEVKNMFSGRYTVSSDNTKKVNTAWETFDHVNNKGKKTRDWVTSQCIQALSTRFFVKISHH